MTTNVKNISNAVDTTDAKAVSLELIEAISIIDILISGMNSGPAWFGDGLDEDDLEKVKKFTLKYKMGWFDPEDDDE